VSKTTQISGVKRFLVMSALPHCKRHASGTLAA
jgi:hypothetical protein